MAHMQHYRQSLREVSTHSNGEKRLQGRFRRHKCTGLSGSHKSARKCIVSLLFAVVVVIPCTFVGREILTLVRNVPHATAPSCSSGTWNLERWGETGIVINE